MNLDKAKRSPRAPLTPVSRRPLLSAIIDLRTGGEGDANTKAKGHPFGCAA